MSKEAVKETMNKLQAAKTEEVKKQIIENARKNLTEKELEQVSAGKYIKPTDSGTCIKPSDKKKK